jgi:hypothetical protein
MTTATLYGFLTDDGGEPLGAWTWFDWGPTVAYGMVSVQRRHFSGETFTEAVAPAPGTYHYRANAQNSFGVANGADMTFVIPAPVVAIPTIFMNRAYPLARDRI